MVYIALTPNADWTEFLDLPASLGLKQHVMAAQFMEHLTANNLHSQLQSAYKQLHSTETALLKVKNDILILWMSNMSPCLY